MTLKITGILRRRHLKQAQAAEILGVDQPKISALMRGHLAGFSVETLLRFLLLLGTDISITIKPRTRTAQGGSRYSNAGVLTVGGSIGSCGDFPSKIGCGIRQAEKPTPILHHPFHHTVGLNGLAV
jgi:predicted XRE-type DNA-binding protein